MEQIRPGRSIPVNGAAVRHLRMFSRCINGVSLAGEAGITSQYLCQIESGKRTHVSPEVFGRLRAALGVETDVLVASHK